MDVRSAAAAPADEVLVDLGTGAVGLSSAEAGRRRSDLGPNAVRTHRATAWPVLVRQLRSPLLVLLALTAAASFFLGERADAVIIGVILVLSVALGFVNEYRAEKETGALHSQIRHRAVVTRDGSPTTVDVTDLVPGDVVTLRGLFRSPLSAPL